MSEGFLSMKRAEWINYHHLYYFRIIALEGGIAKAAKKLRLGQPTLSAQMKQFENTIGQQLFLRKGRKSLQLTESGKVVLDFANEIFRLGDELIDILSKQHLPRKTRVRVGATSTIPKRILQNLFSIARTVEDCNVSFIGGDDDELLRELKTHRLDLVLTNHAHSFDPASRFRSRRIAKLPVEIYSVSRFEHLRKNFPASLSHQPFILPSASSKLRFDLEHLLKLKGIPINAIAEVQDISLQKVLATKGYGLVALVRPAAEELLQHGELILIGTLQELHSEIFLISSEKHFENAVANYLMTTFNFV